MGRLLIGLIELVIGKWGEYKSQKAQTDLERDRIEAETEQNKTNAKAVILTSTGAWWFQLFFIIPLALWFSSVVIYSVFWCQDCAYPQTWTIAALPPPLNDWAAAIVAFLFLDHAVRK